MVAKDTFFSRKLTLNCRGMLLDMGSPWIMGILNHTPDSFYDGGRYIHEKDIADRVEALLSEGADIIDVGCYSSRPGAVDVTAEEERKRMIEVLGILRKVAGPVLLSVDTFRPEIAWIAVEEFGVAMINDIRAGRPDDEMFKVAASLNVPLILMHMKGNPVTMQLHPEYDSLMEEILSFFASRISTAKKYGVHDLIIDPGFGFGKTTAHNFEILRNLELLDLFGLPVLVGISRKSMIYKTLDTMPDHALNGTTALHALALAKGANMLRVHDVKEAREAIRLFEAYKG